VGDKEWPQISHRSNPFLNLGWHGADSDEGGIGEYPDTSAEHQVIEHDFEGQFEFYFCSTDCLRRFLNECVDDLEKKIQASVAEQQEPESK
jgi:hypothetical protein